MSGGSGQALRRLADDVRLRPLGEVAPLLGYRRDPTDRSRCRTGVWSGARILNVTGMHGACARKTAGTAPPGDRADLVRTAAIKSEKRAFFAPCTGPQTVRLPR